MFIFLGEFVLFQLSPNFPGTNNFAIYIIQLLIPNITARTAIYFHIALIAINFQIALLCYLNFHTALQKYFTEMYLENINI